MSKKEAKKAAKLAKKEAKAKAKAEARAAKKAKKERRALEKMRAKMRKKNQEYGNPVTMSLFGLKDIDGCDVEVVSKDEDLANCLTEAFYNAGAKNVERKAK